MAESDAIGGDLEKNFKHSLRQSLFARATGLDSHCLLVQRSLYLL